MSSPAAVLSISAKTQQDIYLTCSPEKTFFKTRCPRYTNFQTVQLSQSIGNGGQCALIGPNTSKARTINTVHQRTADLIGPTYVRTVLPALNTVAFTGFAAATEADLPEIDAAANTGSAATVPALGPGVGLLYSDEVAHFILQRCEIHIGGHRMDEVTAEAQYLEWHANHSDENLLEFSLGIGSVQERIDRAYHDQVMYTPINLWYTRYPSQYLPAIAAQAHEIVYKMDGVAAADMWGGAGSLALLGPAVGNLDVANMDAVNNAVSSSVQEMMYDGVFLDRQERIMLAKNIQEYLMTQFQYLSSCSVTEGQATVCLKNVSFNHPTRHLVIAMRRLDYTVGPTDRTRAPDSITPYIDGLAAGDYKTPILWNDFSAGLQLGTSERLSPIDGLQLKINNYDRFYDIKDGIGHYYNEVHTAQKWSGRTYETFGQYYSFGQYGQGFCASGTLNFSAIDNVEITIYRRVNPTSLFATGGGAVNVQAVAYPAAEVFVHAQSVNVLKFVSGMVATAYAN